MPTTGSPGNVLGVDVCPIRRVPYPDATRPARIAIIAWIAIEIVVGVFVLPAGAGVLVHIAWALICAFAAVLSALAVHRLVWWRWRRRHPLTRTVLFYARERVIADERRESAWLN